MWRKLTANGFTQNNSGNSGSRTVMCPATPSPNPTRPKMRSAAASFFLRCRRSSSTVANGAGSSTPSMVRMPDSVTLMAAILRDRVPRSVAG